MYERFKSRFPRDPSVQASRPHDVAIPAIKGLKELLDLFGGGSFRSGVYRIIHPADLLEWQKRVDLAFPEFGNGLVCFGYDWLGRAFALDTRRSEAGQPGILMLDLGAGEALEIPANLLEFHEGLLLEDDDVALASKFHRMWLKAGGVVPTHDRCIGYKIPLFLGGKDEIENLEESDLDVYWHIIGQVLIQVRDLPPGTVISGFSG